MKKQSIVAYICNPSTVGGETDGAQGLTCQPAWKWQALDSLREPVSKTKVENSKGDTQSHSLALGVHVHTQTHKLNRKQGG